MKGKTVMYAEIGEQWAAALESGEFTQGQHKLTTIVVSPDGTRTEQDCCLGVLCKLAVRAGVTTARERPEYNFIAYGDDPSNESSGVLPAAVVLWAGLDSCNPEVRLGASRPLLAELNDGQNVERRTFSFTEIAAVIREQLISTPA